MIKSEQREIEDRKVYLGHQVVQLMGSVGTLFQVPAIESMPFACAVGSPRGEVYAMESTGIDFDFLYVCL